MVLPSSGSWLLLLNGLMALVWLLFLGSLFWFVTRQRKLKRFQDERIRFWSDAGERQFYRVNFSRPAHFSRWFRLVPIEGKGVLLCTAQGLRLEGLTLRQEPLTRTYPLQAQWLGNPGLRASNLHWLTLGQGADLLYLTADTGLNATQSREATADIFRMIQGDAALPDVARHEFALDKHPATLKVVGLFFALVAFALVDGGFLNVNHELRSSGPALWLMVVLAPLGFLAYPWLTRQKVPARESLVLSMLLGIGLEIAYLPGIKRLDEWLSDGPQAYAYTQSAPARFTPLTPGAPVLNLRRQPEFWAQFPVGSQHQFRLIHGPLGLWQLDRSELNPQMREFYRAYDAKRP